MFRLRIILIIFAVLLSFKVIHPSRIYSFSSTLTSIPIPCGVLSDNQASFETGNDFRTWTIGGSGTWTENIRTLADYSNGSYSMKATYVGATDTAIATHYTPIYSALGDGQQAVLTGRIKVLSSTPSLNLNVCLDHWTDWWTGTDWGGYCSSININNPNVWQSFSVISPQRNAGENMILLLFVPEGGKNLSISYYIDQLCLTAPTSTPTPTPTPTSTPTNTPTPTSTPTPTPTSTPTPTNTPTNTPTPTITLTPTPIPEAPLGTCDSYNPATGTTPVTWTWSSGATGLQMNDDLDWWYNSSAASPQTVHHNDNNAGSTWGIPPGRTVYGRVTFDFITFSPDGTVTCPVPTNTPTPTPTSTPTNTPTPTSTPTPTVDNSSVNVWIYNSSFAPGVLTIQLNSTVVWKNIEPIGHTVSSNSNVFDSSLIPYNGIYRFKFTSPGTYGYYSKMKPQMTGKIIVEDPNAPPTPTLRPGEPTLTPSPTFIPPVVTVIPSPIH